MRELNSTGRLLADHLRAGFRASLLVAFLVTLTVFVVALVPRAFAEVATSELRYQLAQEQRSLLDLNGEGRIGLPAPPRSGEDTLESLLDRTDEAITSFPDTIPAPLADGVGDSVWLLKSVRGTGGVTGVNVVLQFRFAVDLKWSERITYVSGEEPRPWALDEALTGVENPIEIAISEESARVMKLAVGDIIQNDSGPLKVTGVYQAVDPDDSYWSHAYDLANPAVIQETGRPPRIQASVYVAPESIVALKESFALGVLVAWVPIDPSVYSFADLDALATQVRNLTASPVPLPDFGSLNLRSTFTDVLESTEAAVAAISALIALSASGLLGVLIATYALSIQALVRRRRAALCLASARGATNAQLRGVMVLEATLIALPGAALAIVAAALLVPQRVGLDGWLAPIVLAIIPIALAAILVAPGNLREARQDLGVRSTSRARWVIEVAVAGAAVIALVLLQRRGLVASSGVVGIDPLLASTPVLLAASIGLITLRVFPIPLRAVRAMVRSRVSPVAEVGSARAVREPAIGAIATLALVVGVSIVVFSTIMISTIGVSLQRAAEDFVGADVQVNAHDLPESLIDEIRALPDVTGAVALTYRANVTLTDEAGSTRLGVILADPQALAAVRPDLPELDQPTSTGRAILISQSLAERLQGTDIRLVDNPVEPVGIMADTALPGMSGNWLIIDRSAAEDLGLAGQVPSRVLISLDDESSLATVDAIRDAVLAVQPEQFAESARIFDVRTEVGQTRAAPITAGLEGALRIVTGATLLLTMLVVALAATASAASRNRVVGVLRIIGMSPRQVRGLIAWEFGPVAIASLLVGTALGIGLPFLVTAVLDLRGFFGGMTQPSPTLDPAWIALAVGLYAVTVLAAILVATALGRRFAPASTLKMGES